MNGNIKAFLRISAFITWGITSLSIITFGIAAEPDEFGAVSVILACILGGIFSAPFWLPPLIPIHYVKLSGSFRWASATILTYMAYFFSDIIQNFVIRFMQDRSPSFAGLLIGLLLTGICVWGAVVLVSPELRKLLATPKNK